MDGYQEEHDSEGFHWAMALLLFPLLLIAAVLAVLFKLDPDA